MALGGEAAAAGRWIVRLERLAPRIALERRIALPMWRARFARERWRYDPNVALLLETAEGGAIGVRGSTVLSSARTRAWLSYVIWHAFVAPGSEKRI